MDEEKKTTEVKNTTKQVGDTHVTRQTVASTASVPGVVIIQRIIYCLVGFIEVALLVRMVLLLLAANQDNAFVSFVYTLSGLFAVPFFGIFNYTPTYGSSVFELSSLVAIIVYALVGWGLAKLVTLGSGSADEV